MTSWVASGNRDHRAYMSMAPERCKAPTRRMAPDTKRELGHRSMIGLAERATDTIPLPFPLTIAQRFPDTIMR
jgi:hypothetical protein